MKRLLAALIILILAFGNLTALSEDDPTAWDLTELYADEDAWQADLDRVVEMFDRYDSFRGTLGTAQGLRDYLEFAYMGELTAIQNKLYLYAELGCALNPADPVFTALHNRLAAMISAEYQACAFVDAEIYALSLDERQALLDDPLLAPWAYGLRKYVDPDRESLNEETAAALSLLATGLGHAGDVAEILSTLNLPAPRIVLPDGQEVKLTDLKYGEILYSDKYSREVKVQASEAMIGRAAPFAETFAALLEEHITQCWAAAQLNGYSSCLEAALKASDVEPEIYEMLLDAAHRGAKSYQRYLAAHGRALGLKRQYFYDLDFSASDDQPGFIPFSKGVQQVRAALEVLGDDYLAIYDEIVSSGHIDAYPAASKVTGGFTLTMGREYLPYILLNYDGSVYGVRALTHEMGHAVADRFAVMAQQGSEIYETSTIFINEVASTVNELLYFTFMLDGASSDDERLYYLESLLKMFSSTFITQSMYAEFEEDMFEIVESGGALDAQALNANWRALSAQYDGGLILSESDSASRWALVPHFYYDHYVYQYATAVAYAASLCQRLRSGDPQAAEDYKAFLKIGSSQSPSDALTQAGVDPLDPQTYQNALNFYARLANEYARLVDRRMGKKK